MNRRARVGFAAVMVIAAVAAVRTSAAITISDVTIVEPDPSAVAQYSKIELLVTLSEVTATHFYDPDPVAGGLDLRATFVSPEAVVWNIVGFYDGSNWRVRFAPDETGAWTFSVSAQDAGGQAAWSGGGFTCVSSEYSGWARADGHCLRFSGGRALFAVGHNTGWQYYVEQPSLAEMAARGENLLSFWASVPWAQSSWASESEPYWDDRAPIENSEQGLGNYNQAACAYLDGVVSRAESAGVYLLPTIWSHGQLRILNDPHWGSGWWDNNAYNTICSASDFFKTAEGGNDTTQWRYQKNFYRYLIARWGYSRSIAGWVALCEIDRTTGWYTNPTQAESWCVAVRDYFRAADPFRRNASGESPVAFTRNDAPTWKAGFDLRATDSYASWLDDVGVANTLATQTRTMRLSEKPCFHAEFGGDVLRGATQPTHLHNGIWPGTAAGAAMTPLVWCDGGNYPMLTPQMQDHLEYLSQFAAGIDYLGDAALEAAPLSIVAPCRGWGMKLSDRGFAWIQNTAGAMGGQALSISGCAPGSYTVRWYDTWTSGATSARTDVVTVGGDGTLSVAVPALARADIALKFRTNQPPVANDDAAAASLNLPVVIDVTANDSDPDGDDLAVTEVTQGANGGVFINPDGTVTYVPVPWFSGDDVFTYTISDGRGGSDTAAVSVEVAALLNVSSTPVSGIAIGGDAPGTTDYSASLDHGAPVTLTAPAEAAIGSEDYRFARWTINGLAQADDQVAIGFDVTGETTCVAVYETVWRLELKTGDWNLVSLPIDPADGAPSSVFGPNLLGVYAWRTTGGGAYFVPTAIMAKTGYWIAVKADTDVDVLGSLSPTSPVHLVPGWNLVGPRDDAAPPDGVLSIYGWEWPGGLPRYIVPTLCLRGYGYWVAPSAETDIW